MKFGAFSIVLELDVCVEENKGDNAEVDYLNFVRQNLTRLVDRGVPDAGTELGRDRNLQDLELEAVAGVRGPSYGVGLCREDWRRICRTRRRTALGG